MTIIWTLVCDRKFETARAKFALKNDRDVSAAKYDDHRAIKYNYYTHDQRRRRVCGLAYKLRGTVILLINLVIIKYNTYIFSDRIVVTIFRIILNTYTIRWSRFYIYIPVEWRLLVAHLILTFKSSRRYHVDRLYGVPPPRVVRSRNITESPKKNTQFFFRVNDDRLEDRRIKNRHFCFDFERSP